MTDIPYGYRMKDGKLEAAHAESAVVKYMFEAKQRYTEQLPIWGEAVIVDNSIYDAEICVVSDFMKGYVTAEVNALHQLWKEGQKEVPELISASKLPK